MSCGKYEPCCRDDDCYRGARRPRIPKVSPLDISRVLVPVRRMIHHHNPKSAQDVGNKASTIPCGGYAKQEHDEAICELLAPRLDDVPRKLSQQCKARRHTPISLFSCPGGQGCMHLSSNACEPVLCRLPISSVHGVDISRTNCCCLDVVHSFRMVCVTIYAPPHAHDCCLGLNLTQMPVDDCLHKLSTSCAVVSLHPQLPEAHLVQQQSSCCTASGFRHHP